MDKLLLIIRKSLSLPVLLQRYYFHIGGIICNAFGKKELAKKYLKKEIKIIEEHIPERIVSPYISLGLLHASEGELEEAVYLLEKALNIAHENTSILINLGIIYDEMEEEELAIECYHTLLSIEPYYGWAYNNLGYIYYKRKDYAMAISQYEEALELVHEKKDVSSLKPELVYTNLAMVYGRYKNYKEAIKYYKKVLEIDPYNVFIYNEMGILYSRAGNNQKAIDYYKESLKIDQNYAWTYNNLGVSYYETGQVEKAIRYLKMSINLYTEGKDSSEEFNPDYAKKNLIKIAQENSKKWENIKYFLKKNLDIDIEEEKNQITENETLYQRPEIPQVNIENLLLNYDKALEINPADAIAYYGLALCYKQLGKINEAIKYFKKYIELAPQGSLKQKALMHIQTLEKYKK